VHRTTRDKRKLCSRSIRSKRGQSMMRRGKYRN
jgi:hypothetical protein